MHPTKTFSIRTHTDTSTTGPSLQAAPDQNTSLDPMNRLAEVLVGMNNKPSAQPLMVRPVSTTTLTFDGKLENFELFEGLFHTMIKMQPDMTETMKYVKPETQATAKHK